MLCLFFLQNARLAFSPSTSSPNPTLLYAPHLLAPPMIKSTANQQQSIKRHHTHHNHKPTDILFLRTEVNLLSQTEQIEAMLGSMKVQKKQRTERDDDKDENDMISSQPSNMRLCWKNYFSLFLRPILFLKNSPPISFSFPKKKTDQLFLFLSSHLPLYHEPINHQNQNNHISLFVIFLFIP